MKLLVVEDDVELRQAVCASASNWTIVVREHGIARNARFTHVAEVGSLAEGLAHLRADADSDLVVVDVRLGQESGIKLVEHINRSGRAPAILAVSGQATAGEAFQLAVLGVRGYLAKPFDMRELRAGIQAIFDQPPDLATGAMALVGRRHIHVVQDEVKLAMLKRALQWEHGNISRAAKRLGVTRTAVQQMIDRYGLRRPSDSPNNTDEE